MSSEMIRNKSRQRPKEINLKINEKGREMTSKIHFCFSMVYLIKYLQVTLNGFSQLSVFLILVINMLLLNLFLVVLMRYMFL